MQADARAVQAEGPLQLRALGLQNGDGSIAGEGLGAHLQLRYRAEAQATRIATAGELRGGEFLVGNTYVALPAAPVGVQLEAVQQGRDGWRLPRIAWNDGAVLTATAQAALDAEGHLDSLSVQARSDDLTPLKPRYLSGWMGLAGLGGVDLHGGLTLAAMGWRTLAGGRTTGAESEQVKDEDAQRILDSAFYPYTFPLTVGPGTMVVLLTLSAHVTHGAPMTTLLSHAAIFIAALLQALLVYLCYRYAPKLAQRLSPSAINAVQQLMAFILLCIGGQIAWGGVSALARQL